MSGQPQAQADRLPSVDLVRGIAMVLMALDHTRDFFGVPADPTNLARASAALFMTRWITHFCAPTFFLLTGVGAGLSLRRRSVGDLSRFLFTRGLWLLVFETVVMRCLAYQFNVDYRVTMLLVLWALGWSMIGLAGLVYLPMRVIAMFALVLIVGHNALDGVRLANPLWAVLHGPGFVVNTSRVVVFAAYPLVPWLGVTALGFVLAGVYDLDAARRRQWLVRGGFAAIVAFVALRWLNVYGDPSRWAAQPSPLFTLLSFLNATKYPPSLLFLLMTLGPVALMLAAVERASPSLVRPIVIFGRVPLFYYAGHFFLLHLAAVGVALVRYGSAHWMFESPDLARYPFTPPPGWGYALPVVYVTWILVVRLMYPLSTRYARLKASGRSGWLSYF